MTYYETPGVLADIASFMAIYYNEEFLTNRFMKPRNINPSIFWDQYYTLKFRVSKLPEELHPFAYSSDQVASFLTKRVHEDSLDTLTLMSFLEYLKSEQFYTDFIYYWFGTVDRNCVPIESKCIDFFVNPPTIAVTDDIKYMLFLVLSDFNNYRIRLADVITTLHEYVTVQRNEQRDLLEKSKGYYDNPFMHRFFSDLHHINISDYRYTIEMISAQIVYFNDHHKKIFIGYKCKEFISQSTNISTFAFIFNDPFRVQLVEYILQNQPAGYQSILEHFDNHEVIIRFQVDLLIGEGIILRSISANRNVYYVINQDYFVNLPFVFKEKFSKLMNSQ